MDAKAIKRVEASIEVQEALASYGASAPLLEPLHDGAIIVGHVCGLTIGRLVLMEVANDSVFSGAHSEEPSIEDILSTIYFTMDDSIDDAVWLAADPLRKEKVVKKFWRGYSKRARRKAVSDFSQWMARISLCLPLGDSQDSDKRPKWWVGVVDILASEYGWGEHYILWELPLVRAVYYQEAILQRKTGEDVPDEISDDIIAALEAAERVLEDG